MKYIFKVTVDGNERYTGTLDACIKRANKINIKEILAYGCRIEIWALEKGQALDEAYYCSTLDRWWEETIWDNGNY